MKRLLIVLIVFFLLDQSSVFAQTKSRVPGVVLVKFKGGHLKQLAKEITTDDVNDVGMKNLLKQFKFSGGRKIFRNTSPADTIALSRTGEQVKLIDLSGWYALKLEDTANIDSVVSILSKHPSVITASPSMIFHPQGIFPNDPRFQQNLQWGLYNFYSPGKDIHAPQAWEKQKGSSDVIIAVIDGGVDYNHSDLDPGDRSRVIQGYDTGDDDNDPMDDINSIHTIAGHGTGVAGVLGAITNNGNKVAGVMWNCKMMPLKASSTSGPWWDPMGWSIGSLIDWNIADAIDWARNNGAHIINMSFAGTGNDWWETHILGGNPVTEATWNAYQQGVLLVAGMGNDDNNTEMYPAAYPWVTAVGATNQNDRRVTGVGWGSNYGSHISVTAPGISYYSTDRGQSEQVFGGTSCATPIVAGVAGLIMSESRDHGLDLTNDDVKHLIEVTSDDQGDPGWDQYYGYGRVNADSALTLLRAPYTLTQNTITSSNATLVWDMHQHIFYNNAGLATGTYYVKTYKATKRVSFPIVYSQAPIVWLRDRQIIGWDCSNPNLNLPWARITNVDQYGFDVESFIYWIECSTLGQTIRKYWPGNSDIQQATFAYTIIGIPEQVNVNLLPATFFESGSGGTYKVYGENVGSTWSGTISGLASIEAVPPEGYEFYQWNDGDTTNPRPITNNENITLHAIYVLYGVRVIENMYPPSIRLL